MTQNELKAIANEINEEMSYGIEEEELPMVFKSMIMNKNYYNMLNVMYAVFDEALLYLPSEHVFELYKNFEDNFDFDFHTELLAKEFEDWVIYEKCNPATFMPVLELLSKVLYSVKYEIENNIHVIEDEEYSVLYNIYMSMLPYIPAKYLF